MKGMKLFRAGVLVVLCFLGLCGCMKQSSGETEETAVAADTPGWKLHAEDKVTLDWYIHFSWYTTPWGDNLVSRKITDETGISVRFVTPAGNEQEKLNVLMASGTLPDLITLGWWENQIDEMIDQDMVYALNELADQYDTYFWKVADPTLMEWNKKEDGNVYYYNNSSYTPEDFKEHKNIGSNQTFLVRKDIYEAIGSPDMTTPEGFMDAVRKAAKMFPEVDGEPLIPIGAHMFTNEGCASFDQYLLNFLAIPYEKDGEYYDRYTDPEFVAWLKVFRQLGEEGYLNKDIFIDQRTQMEEKLVQGRYFCMIYQRSDIWTQQKAIYAAHPERIYLAADGPKNSKGADYVLPVAGINGWTVTLISKNCERPDRAIELFSYLMSEHGQKLTYLGVEGVTYDMVNGKAVLKPEVQKLLDTDREEYDRIYGADCAYWMFQDNVMQLQWTPQLREPTGQLEEWTYPYTHYLGQYEITYDTNTQVGNEGVKIQNLWGEVLPKLLLAPSEEEFDRLFADYVAQREQLGFAQVQQESTRQINEAKKKLGISEVW
jgi:putative aldouronate transport system substrate-binding protein